MAEEAPKSPTSSSNGSASDRPQSKKPLPKLPSKPTHGRARSVGGDVHFESSDNIIPTSPHASDDAYRNKILAELLSTERSYITSLEQLTNIIKFLKSAPEEIVSPKQVARISSNTDMLLNFHRSGLLPQLESLIGRQAVDVNVGSVIISFMPFLKATYAQFVNNYTFAISTLKELVANAKFNAFISSNWKPDGPGSSFETYVDLRLITPVQRIPRYEMLLKDLLRHTPSTHKEYATLSEAYNRVREVAEFVNTKKAEAERMHQLLALQSSLREDQHRQSIVLALPGRFLVSETRVNVHRSSQVKSASASHSSSLSLGPIGSNSGREGKIIMFNDCVLIARKKSSAANEERLSFSALLYLKPLIVQDLGGLDFSLQAEKDALRSSIVKEGKTFRFSALNEASKTQLLNAIRDAKALLSSKEAAAKNRNRPRLHYAIKQGDMNTVQEVVKNDPNCVNAPDRKGHTALHAAVKRRDQDLAKYLIAQGANVKALATDGLTPIDLATKLGDEGMLAILQPKSRTSKQDEGLLHGVAGVGSAVGTVVGKGLFMPLRMFKKDESANNLPVIVKRDPSTPESLPASVSDEQAEKQLDEAKKEGSKKTLLPSFGSMLSRGDKDKDKLTLSSSSTASSPLQLSSQPPSSASSPRVKTTEERVKEISTRIGDIELHMAALMQEKTTLEAELQRLQTTPHTP